MQTCIKLLKITGAICLSGVCLTSKAEPKLMTLEELKVFLDREYDKRQKNLASVKEEIKEHGLISGEFCERLGGITHVEYNDTGEPALIESTKELSEEALEVLQDITYGNPSFGRYIGKKFSDKTATAYLDKVSKILTTEELNARGITESEKELLRGAPVREITFDSILESSFFDDTHRKKGKLWFSNPEQLKQAVDDYLSNAPLLKFVTYRRKSNWITLESKESQNSTSEIQEKVLNSNEGERRFVYKASGERYKKMKEVFASNFKKLLHRKNGKEKIILLLLLDEVTPSECRLQWVADEDDAGGMYDPHKNWILLDYKEGGWVCLSHEIGHYLQTHLGLQQTAEDYQIKFARELLLLEPTETQTDRELHIPMGLSIDLNSFDESGKYLKQLSGKDLFARWQLTSRWGSRHEISNILGIYFSHIQKAIYICALSDIRETRCIRYGHDPRGMAYGFLADYSEGDRTFEDSEEQVIFENMVAEAAKQRPSMDVLRLLCKLHERSGDEDQIINSFDYDSVEAWINAQLSLKAFRTADE